MASAAYFDDLSVTDLEAIAQHAQPTHEHVLELVGSLPALAKRQLPAGQRVCLGAAVDVGQVHVTGFVYSSQSSMQCVASGRMWRGLVAQEA